MLRLSFRDNVEVVKKTVVLEQVLTKSTFLHDFSMEAIGGKLWNHPA